MKKKITALLITATMALSLVGCGRNYDGKYTADVDLTELWIDVMNEAHYGNKNYKYDYKGSVIVPYELEISDGEYTITVDKKEAEEILREFTKENSGYWKVGGYQSENAYVNDIMQRSYLYPFNIDESGDIKTSGDKITLEDFCSDGVTLNYDNGELKGDWAPEVFEMVFELDFKPEVEQ